MSLRSSLAKLLVIACTSTGLVAFSSFAAQAATFNLSYIFQDGTAFSALLDGELGADSNSVSVSQVKSSSVTKNGQNVYFMPGGLAFSSSLTLDGGFVSFGLGSLSANGTHEQGFTLFNTSGVHGLHLSFADLGYGNGQRQAEGFRYDAYSLQTVPENVSTSVLLTALAGMSLAAYKRNQKQAA
jgi:hypothetical protein